MPSSRSLSSMKRNSCALVSKVPTTRAVRPIRSAKRDGKDLAVFQLRAGHVPLLGRWAGGAHAAAIGQALGVGKSSLARILFVPRALVYGTLARR